MRKLFVKIIQLLDGTPAVYGKRQSGQSVVELALITPILIVLLAGLVEIGWFANNYLNLLDVTRAGARRGAVLQDQSSPLFWDNAYSLVPNVMLPVAYQVPYDGTNGDEFQRFYYRWMPGDTGPSGSNPIYGSDGIRPCDPDERDTTFYREVTCTMIITMDPLEMNYENGEDDIVVSAFAMQLVDATSNPTWLAPGYDTTEPQVVVAGRYPTNANECNYQLDALGDPVLVGDVREGRDPFDFNGNGARDVDEVSGAVFTEIYGFDNGLTSPEKQVGFSLFGNHKIAGYACVGSEWTMAEIEDLMNLDDFDLVTLDERNAMPSQGVVIAEIYWEHEMLLKFPLLSPVYIAVGDPNGRMVIHIWAAFPLSSIEPHVKFP